MTYAVVGHAGEIAVGRGGFSRGFSPSFGHGVLPAPGRVRAKKSSGPAAASADVAGAAAGVRSNAFIVLLILAQRGIPQPAAALFERACGGRTRAQPHGAEPAPWDFSVVCRPGSSHRSVIFLRVLKLLCQSSRSGAREIASMFGDEQDPASSGKARPGGALPAPGQAGHGEQREGLTDPGQAVLDRRGGLPGQQPGRLGLDLPGRWRGTLDSVRIRSDPAG